MSRCQSVFLITGEPYSKWQLSCTVVNMVTMLHPLLCSDWLIAQRRTCSEYAQRICCNLYYWSQILGFDASSALHPALHTAPCLSQNGAYVAAESGEYGWCSLLSGEYGIHGWCSSLRARSEPRQARRHPPRLRRALPFHRCN